MDGCDCTWKMLLEWYFLDVGLGIDLFDVLFGDFMVVGIFRDQFFHNFGLNRLNFLKYICLVKFLPVQIHNPTKILPHLNTTFSPLLPVFLHHISVHSQILQYLLQSQLLSISHLPLLKWVLYIFKRTYELVLFLVFGFGRKDWSFVLACVGFSLDGVSGIADGGVSWEGG